MCTLVLILWGHSFNLGFYKACFYDCGEKRFGYYDEVYRVHPEAYCPARYDKA